VVVNIVYPQVCNVVVMVSLLVQLGQYVIVAFHLVLFLLIEKDNELFVSSVVLVGRGKREEGRGKREEGRGKREEGRGKREEGRAKRGEEEKNM
jgi:hypothetical protein